MMRAFDCWKWVRNFRRYSHNWEAVKSIFVGIESKLNRLVVDIIKFLPMNGLGRADFRENKEMKEGVVSASLLLHVISLHIVGI